MAFNNIEVKVVDKKRKTLRGRNGIILAGRLETGDRQSQL